MAQQFAVEPRPPDSTTRPRRWPQAIAAAGCTAVVIIAPKSIAAMKVTFTSCSPRSCRSTCRGGSSERSGDPRPIVFTVGALFTLAVVTIPKFATDIWSYTMVGRILAVHHLNPYRTAPAAVHRSVSRCCTERGERTTPYGPLSVVHARLVRWCAARTRCSTGSRSSRRRRSWSASRLAPLAHDPEHGRDRALVGLDPMVAGSIVNGGHNDAVVALGLLGVVLLLARSRIGAAGWVLVTTTLVKLTIGYAVIPVAVWTATRYGSRALRPLLAPTIAGGAVMAAIPGAAHSMTNANGGVVTRLAVWNVLITCCGWRSRACTRGATRRSGSSRSG